MDASTQRRTCGAKLITDKDTPSIDLIIDTESNKQAFRQLLQVIRSKQAIAFTGAGVSRPLGYPTWDVLIDRLATETIARCGDHIIDDQGRSITVAQVVEMRDLLFRAEIFKGNLGARYFEIIRETFGPKDGQIADIRDLVSLPFQHLLTSNYDTVLERAQDDLQVGYESICLYDAPANAFVNNLANYDYDRRVVHVHGRFDDPEKIVLTESEYAALYHSSTIARLFWQMVPILRRRVFFGFSFIDMDLTAGFNLGNFNRAQRENHVGVVHFVCVALDDKDQEGSFRALYNMKYGIEPVFFDRVDSGFSGYSTLIRILGRKIAPPPKELRVGLAEALATEVEEAAQPAVPAGPAVAIEEHIPEPLNDDVAHLEHLTESNLKKRATGDLD